MTGARLDLAWDTQSEVANFAVSFTSPTSSTLVRQVGPGRRTAHCPECDSIIYSRRHKLCGVCGQALPANLLFTVMEAQRVEALVSTERQRHKKWMEQRANRDLG